MEGDEDRHPLTWDAAVSVARVFLSVMLQEDTAMPSISGMRENSCLFYRKVIQYSSENSFWSKKLDDFMIPKGALYTKIVQVFIKLTLI